MEEIDMDMSRIYDAMDEGFEMINKEAAEKHFEIMKRSEFEGFLQEHLRRLVPEPLVPYLQLVGLHYPDNRSYQVMLKEMTANENYSGWFKVKIPDFALMAFHINMCKEISFWIFNSLMKFDDIDDSECWSDNSIHKNVKDYRLALALAKQVWEVYVKFEGSVELAAGAGAPDPKAEVYEPVEVEEFTVDIARENYIFSLIDKQLKHYGLI